MKRIEKLISNIIDLKKYPNEEWINNNNIDIEMLKVTKITLNDIKSKNLLCKPLQSLIQLANKQVELQYGLDLKTILDEFGHLQNVRTFILGIVESNTRKNNDK